MPLPHAKLMDVSQQSNKLLESVIRWRVYVAMMHGVPLRGLSFDLSYTSNGVLDLTRQRGRVLQQAVKASQ